MSGTYVEELRRAAGLELVNSDLSLSEIADRLLAGPRLNMLSVLAEAGFDAALPLDELEASVNAWRASIETTDSALSDALDVAIGMLGTICFLDQALRAGSAHERAGPPAAYLRCARIGAGRRAFGRPD